jgi:hypothetical protein
MMSLQNRIKEAEQRLMGELNRRELRLLLTLSDKPLSAQDIVAAMAPISEHDTKETLYQLGKKYLITKQPVAIGGCRECVCQISYLWRLTFAGREALSKSETK